MNEQTEYFKGLGRRVPTDFDHVQKYPLRRMMAPEPTVDVAERTLSLPVQYIPRYDQGAEGACVGYAISWMASILNRRFYDARRLYREAQLVDEWADTPPGEGTSVRAGLDILRNVGHWAAPRHGGTFSDTADPAHGISENRWATTVDQIRYSIQVLGSPVVLGVWWYRNFSSPVRHNGAWWIGRGTLGRPIGGHAICAYRVSDRRQAFGLVNSWGRSYPLVWVPYDVVQRLINEDGEAGLVTDKL